MADRDQDSTDESGDITRRGVFRLTAMAGAAGVVGPGTAMALDDEDGDTDETPQSDRAGETVDEDATTQEVDNNAIINAIATDKFAQAVESTEYKGKDGQITTFQDTIQEFPLEGDSFTVLSSGNASEAPGDPGTFSSTNMDGREFPNYSPDNFDAFDVAEFRIDFTVPDGAEGVAFDYKFANDESPQYLDSEFQDFFEAALITPDGNPTNIARLPDGNPVTVDNADDFANTPGGNDSQNPDPPLPDPQDTTFNAVTEQLTAERSVAGNQGQQVRLIVRIADASDGVFDSAAFIDNLRFVGELENPTIAIEDAFDMWRNNLPVAVKSIVRSEARTLARLYKAHGAAFSDPMTKMMGYRAGQVSESEINDEFVKIVEDLSTAVSESTAQTRYDFYQELFSAVSTDDTVDSITQTFFQYHMGTASGQSNYLRIEGNTIKEAIDARVSQINDYESKFISDVKNADYSGSEIQKIASYIDQKAQYFNRLRVETLRSELTLVEQLTGEESFEGGFTVTKLEGGGALAPNDLETEAIDSSGNIVSSEIKKVGGASTYKGGITLSEGLKSTETPLAVDRIGTQYGIGTGADTAWLTEKPKAAATLFHQDEPSWLSWLGQTDSQNMFEAAAFTPILTTADKGLEYLLGWSPAAQLDEYMYSMAIDETLETEYTSPDECLREAKKEIAIKSVNATDLSVTDYYEDLWPPYGKQEGKVIIENTGDVAFKPMVELSVFADIGAIGRQIKTNHPVIVTDPVEELEPGEADTLYFEYLVPVGLFTSNFEVKAAVRRFGETASAAFTSGTVENISSSKDVASDSLSDGESKRYDVQVSDGTYRTTFSMEYTNLNADLHLYDSNGNHVGKNYETNEFEDQIDNATHSGDDEGALGNEYVEVVNPDSQYEIKVQVPDVETIIQSDETVAKPTQGGGNVEFDVNSSEVPDLNGKLSVTTEQAKSDGGQVSFLMEIREISEQAEVTNVSLSAADLSFNGETIPADNISFGTQDFTVAKGSTTDVTVTVDVPEALPAGNYTGDLTVTGNGGDLQQTETMSVLVPPLPLVENKFPKDPDGDGLYQDVNGDGKVDIFDVQDLFDKLESDPVVNNPEAFNFDGESGKVDIFDVQALFNQLPKNNQ